MESDIQMNNEVIKEKKSNGAIVGSIIIVVILIIGGIYLTQTQIKKVNEQKNLEQQVSADNLLISDDLNDIESDLINNADIETLDQELE